MEEFPLEGPIFRRVFHPRRTCFDFPNVELVVNYLKKKKMEWK